MISRAPHGPGSSPPSPRLLASPSPPLRASPSSHLRASPGVGSTLQARTNHCFESPTVLHLDLEWIAMFEWKCISLQEKLMLLYRCSEGAVPRTC